MYEGRVCPLSLNASLRSSAGRQCLKFILQLYKYLNSWLMCLSCSYKILLIFLSRHKGKEDGKPKKWNGWARKNTTLGFLFGGASHRWGWGISMLSRVTISTPILSLPKKVLTCLLLMKTDCRARVVRVASSSNGLVDSGNERSSDWINTVLICGNGYEPLDQKVIMFIFIISIPQIDWGRGRWP